MSVAVTTTSSISVADCDQAGAPTNAPANARQRLRLRSFPGTERGRGRLRWSDQVAELRVVKGLIWLDCFNLCSSRWRKHMAGSSDDPCPVPSAGMIRIRFNGFANRHLRFKPPRRCEESTTVAVNHRPVAFGGSALCHRVVIVTLLQWWVSFGRCCAQRSSPISPAMMGRL